MGMISAPPGVYPARGVVHLYRHPNLNRKVGGFLAGTSSASFIGTAALAWGTYGAQLRFIGTRLGTGFFGKLATGLLILGEASIPIFFVFNQTMLALQKSLFEDVLRGTVFVKLQGRDKGLVKQLPQACMPSTDQGVYPVRKLSSREQDGLASYMETQKAKHAAEQASRKTIKGFAFHAAQSTIISAITSPLAAVVPFAPVLLSFASGDRATIPFMAQYLKLRGVTSSSERQAIADSHKLAYRQFGIAAALFSSIPIASWGFQFSNTVGAALWAADLEKRNEQLF